jgi:hypothetical protein
MGATHALLLLLLEMIKLLLLLQSMRMNLLLLLLCVMMAVVGVGSCADHASPSNTIIISTTATVASHSVHPGQSGHPSHRGVHAHATHPGQTANISAIAARGVHGAKVSTPLVANGSALLGTNGVSNGSSAIGNPSTSSRSRMVVIGIAGHHGVLLCWPGVFSRTRSAHKWIHVSLLLLLQLLLLLLLSIQIPARLGVHQLG